MSATSLGTASALPLDPGARDRDRRDVVAALHEEWAALVGCAGSTADGGDPDGVESRLPNGLASAPRDAARCLLDVERASVLLRAAAAAIEERRARSVGRPVRVLYAGCGPLAPLAPLTHTALSRRGGRVRAARRASTVPRRGRVARPPARRRGVRFEPVTVRLPSPLPASFVPMIRTAIQAHGELRLGDSRSGLTQPLPLPDLEELSGGETLEFRYVLGESPGLVHRRV